MTTHDDTTGPTPEQIKAWDTEAKERWGHTDAYQESTRRMKQYSKEDIARFTAEQEAAMRKLAAIMDKGVEDPEVQAIIEGGQKFINDTFYPCDVEMYEKLALLKTQDDRYAEFYRKFHPDLPEFHTKAVLYYCARKRKAS